MLTREARIAALKDVPQKLLDGATVSVDRMPMLQTIFDRTASQCSDSLRQWSSCPVLFSVNSIASKRIGDVLDSFEGNVVAGVFYVQALDSRLLVALEHEFVFALAEALFGGDGGEARTIEKRQLSNIELRLSHKAFDVIGSALQSSVADVCETILNLERVETRLDFVTIAPRTAIGVTANLRVRVLGRDSDIIILIPQTALNSVRQDLVRDLTTEMSVRDPRWTRQIQSEIGRTEIAVRGVIEERHVTLGDIAGLQVGQVLPLQATARTRVKLEGNAQPIFWCDLGQVDGHYTLRIDEIVDQDQDFIEGLVQV
jgi:flagellar motor switch protein FliM